MITTPMHDEDQTLKEVPSRVDALGHAEEIVQLLSPVAGQHWDERLWVRT